MTEASSRFGFPFILPGQAQKEIFHNEALQLIDTALHAAVEAGPLDSPPFSPGEGQIWLVGANPDGDWIGRAGALASWSDGGWRFLAPVAGMLVWNKVSGHWLHWTGTTWSEGELPVSKIVISGVQVVGPRLPELPSPSGGTVIDQEARAAIAAVIAAFKSHGLTD